MASLLIEEEQVGTAADDESFDEGCVWCEAAEHAAHTMGGFCQFCGSSGHEER